jgi:hypothetical protein
VTVFAALCTLLRRRAFDIATPAEGRALLRTRISLLGDAITYVAREVAERGDDGVLRAHAQAVESALQAVARELRWLLWGWRVASGVVGLLSGVLNYCGRDPRAPMPMALLMSLVFAVITFVAVSGATQWLLRHLLVRWLRRASL